MEREEVRFESGSDSCAAWLYRGGPTCVVMAHGFSLTRHDGLAPYAERLAAAGATVLVFDHRFLGDAGGEPRQRFGMSAQQADWRAAVTFARTLPGVDAGRVVLWGFSFSAGHAVEIAVADPRVAAVLALCPFVDGLARVLATPPKLSAWIMPRAIADALGRPTTIPVTAPPGGRAAMTLPGESDGFERAIPPGSQWRNRISAGVFLTVGTHRPVAKAARIAQPLWVGLGERDVSVSARAVRRLAERAPQGELHVYPYDHFDAFTGDEPDRVASDQVAFLRRESLLS